MAKGISAADWESEDAKISGGFYRSSQGSNLDNENRKSTSSTTSNNGKPFLPEPSQTPSLPPKPPAKNQSQQSYNLSFTQQLQQISRHKGRPGSRLLSPHAEPHSPIYASPPQSPSSDSVNDERISPMNAFSAASFPSTQEFTSPTENRLLSNTAQDPPILSNGCNLGSFAFSRV